MDINNLSLDNIEMYCHGRMNFMVGLCEQLKISDSQKKILKILSIPEEIFYWKK